MKLVLTLFLVFCAVLACTRSREPKMSEANNSVKAWDMIRQGGLVLDVRTPEEFSAGHIHGAVNIPHDQIAQRLSEIDSHKARPIVLYCKSGRRAGMAEEVLKNNGYTNTFNAGGFSDLSAAKP